MWTPTAGSWTEHCGSVSHMDVQPAHQSSHAYSSMVRSPNSQVGLPCSWAQQSQHICSSTPSQARWSTDCACVGMFSLDHWAGGLPFRTAGGAGRSRQCTELYNPGQQTGQAMHRKTTGSGNFTPEVQHSCMHLAVHPCSQLLGRTDIDLQPALPQTRPWI